MSGVPSPQPTRGAWGSVVSSPRGGSGLILGQKLFFTARCTIVQSAVLRLHVVRPSVCPSVTLVDQEHIHVGWKSWKLIAPTISPPPSLFVAQRPSTYSQGNTGKIQIWWRLEVGWEKVACWSTKAAISLKRVKIEDKLLWRNSPTHFRMVPSLTP